LINGMVRGDDPTPDHEPTVAAGLVSGLAGQSDNANHDTFEPATFTLAVETPAASTLSETHDDLVDGIGTQPVVTPAQTMEEGTTASTCKNSDADEAGSDEAGSDEADADDAAQVENADTFDAGDFDISEEELISMRALSRFIGRSPRTVKRFINTYKLFKAMRIPPGTGVGTDETYGPDDIATDHVPIMILLAVQIGHPDVAFQLFNAFDAALEADDSQSIGQVIKTLQTAVPSDVNPDKWRAVLDSFYSVHDLWGDDPTLIDIGIAALDPWLLGTSRFGFKEWVPDADRLWG
jgi:hypothetical protein